MKDVGQYQDFYPSFLDEAGLNRQAVFNIDDLPADIARSIRNIVSVKTFFPRQVILVGHGGRMLWDRVKQSGIESENPIDDFTVRTVAAWFSACHSRNGFEILYPGNQGIGLQRLGQLAGWHHPSPLMIGIDPEWGTWYAYRAVVAADTAFAPTRPRQTEAPCAGCAHRVCLSRCPGDALAEGRFDLGKCVAYRRRAGSACRATCLARVACPVGSEHRYSEEQLRHTYARSLEAIEGYCRG